MEPEHVRLVMNVSPKVSTRAGVEAMEPGFQADVLDWMRYGTSNFFVAGGGSAKALQLSPGIVLVGVRHSKPSVRTKKKLFWS